jgi:hypothetical protein
MRDSVKTAGRLIVAGALLVAPAAAVCWAQAGDGNPAPARSASATTDGSPSAPPPASPTNPSGSASPAPAPQVAPNAGAPAAQPNAQQLADQRLVEQAHAVLAERFCEMAQARLRATVVTDAMWRQAIILLDAAHQLDPTDPRYMRMQYEIALKANDVDRAIRVLTEYKKSSPDDIRAQLSIIDLYVARMQTADEKLSYLVGDANKQGLVQKQTVLPEVRSHAAELAAPLLLDRNRQWGMQMLDQAIQLNPLNVSAMRLKYSLLDAKTPVVDRTALLLALLRANPAQPAAMSELADHLADLGLAQEAARWYAMARPLFTNAAQQVPPDFVTSHTAQLFLLAQPDAASGLLAQYLVQRPMDADAWFVRLAVEHTRGAQADPSVVPQARQAFEQRLQAVSDRIQASAAAADRAAAEGGAAAVTAPAAAAPPTPVPATTGSHPDVAPAIAALGRPSAAPEEKGAFASTVGDLAFFEIYFGNDLQQAQVWIDALSKVPPSDETTLPRLKGWMQLAKGNADEARKLLEPIAKKDPVAAVGLVRLNADKKAGDAEAVRLLGENRSGMVAALLWGEFKARGVKPPAPAGDEVKAVRANLAAFPPGLLEILTAPQKFYAVRLDPARVAHGYREPMYVRITIQNTSTYDLTIGSDGVIHPDLLFGARVAAGQWQQEIGALAYDRIAGPLVIKPNKSVSGQFIRLDQGPLLQQLDARPGATIEVAGYVVTNPAVNGQAIEIGPGGQRTPFSRKIVRQGFNVANPAAVGKIMDTLQNGQPGEKVAAMDLLAAYVPLLIQQANGNKQMQQLAQDFIQALSAKQGDPMVSGFAMYNLARVHPDALERAQYVAQMGADAEWTTRVLSLEAAPAAGLKPEQMLEMADTMAKRDIQGLPNPDGEAMLRAFAAAQVELIKNPPVVAQVPGATTGPTSGPTSGPSTSPTSGPATAPAPGTKPATEVQPASRPAPSRPAPAVQPATPSPALPPPAAGNGTGASKSGGAAGRSDAPVPPPEPAPSRPLDAATGK